MKIIAGIPLSLLCFTIINSETSPTTLRTTVNTAPFEFPESDQNYNFIYNSSLRAELENKTAIIQNDTEVDDLLGLDTTKSDDNGTKIKLNEIIQPNPSEFDEDLSRKNDTEWLQTDPDKTEDKRVEINEIVKNQSMINVNGDFPLDGNVAAVLAVVFLVISIVGYMTLMSRRRHLENRYGSRQIIVNEDFNDPDDLKHFTI